MSGGYFDYRDSGLKYDIFGYGDECTNVFEDYEISELIWDVFDLIHDFDWYKSGDTSKPTYLKSKQKFKDKWLGNDEDRVKRVVDTAIEKVRQELYETYGVKGADDEQMLYMW